MLSPFSIELTDIISLDAYPIHVILAIYLGYRMGRWYGAAAGIAMLAPWLIWSTEAFIEAVENVDLLEELYLSDRSVTVDATLVGAAFGWAAGFVSDFVENALIEKEIFLASYFPRRRTSLLAFSGQKLQLLFKNWGGNKDDNSDSAKPKHTLDSMVTNIRSLGMRINQLAVVPTVLITLNVLVVIELYDSDSSFLQLNLIPFGLSALLLIIIGYITASRIAVFISFLVWFGSLIAIASEFGLFGFYYDVAMDFDIPISAFSSVVGVSILVWISARLGRIHRSGELRESLLQAITPYRRDSYSPPAASLTALMPILFLFIACSITFEFGALEPVVADTQIEAPLGEIVNGPEDESITNELDEIIIELKPSSSSYIFVGFQPWTLIFSALVFLGSRYDARGISNRFVVAFVPLMFIHFGFWIGESVTLTAYVPTVGDFLMLAIAPFLGKYFDLSQLRVCRFLLASGWLLSSMLNVYIFGYIDSGIVSVSDAISISLILQLVFIELLARLLCRVEISTGNIGPITGRKDASATT